MQLNMEKGTKDTPGCFLNTLLPINKEARLMLKWPEGAQSRLPSPAARLKNSIEDETTLRS